MAFAYLRKAIFLLLLSVATCFGAESDIQCLKTFKKQLTDPNNSLSSWGFTNLTEGSICKFNGVECWHPDENSVFSIQLSNMGLQGQFPLSLENCTKLQGLNLSHNRLSGPIPSDISSKLQYVTSLDLSSNQFSGEIPSDIENCPYLNFLNLENNQLTGQIPEQLGNLTRLQRLNLSSNLLSGKVPHFQRSFGVASFANNRGLCGGPFEACKMILKPPKKSHTSVIIGSAVGTVLLVALAISIVPCFRIRRASRHKKKDASKINRGLTVKSTNRVNGSKLRPAARRSRDVKLSMFAQTVPKMRLIDLLKATENFSKDNIIGSGRRGTMYKGIFPDGSLVAVKRLQDCHNNSHKYFMSEMTTLGSTKHHNLVPLLGFCATRRERLLIYKYMQNGTLYQRLHRAGSQGGFMEWPQRLRISIGVARGLAWLHHKCKPSIVHRNITSSAVLLDEYYEPKLSDFRSAKLMNSFISSIFGDAGYVAPEFEHALDAIPKGDVYRFGVVMLELVTGREPAQVTNAPDYSSGNLVEWIAYLSNFSRLQDAIDKSLIGRGYDEELMEFLKVACACVEFVPERRPTMFEVYKLLRAICQRFKVSAEDRMFMKPPYSVSIACQGEITEEQELLE